MDGYPALAKCAAIFLPMPGIFVKSVTMLFSPLYFYFFHVKAIPAHNAESGVRRFRVASFAGYHFKLHCFRRFHLHAAGDAIAANR